MFYLFYDPPNKARKDFFFYARKGGGYEWSLKK